MRLLLAATVGLGVGFGLSFSAPVLGALAVQAWPIVPAGQQLQQIDRTHKGDRLDIPTTRIGKRPVEAPKVLIGCEPAASPLAGSTAAMAGRCAA